MPGVRLPGLGAFQVWGSSTDVGKTLLSAGLAANSGNYLRNLRYIKPVQTGYPDDDDSLFVKRHAKPQRDVDVKVLLGYRDPVSPHRAVEASKAIEDSKLIQLVSEEIGRTSDSSISLVETAGGVLSPAPSGSLQADVYRPLRMTAVLVGSGQLGGISETLSAYESLLIRGYDVPVVFVFGTEHENHKAIDKAVDANVLVAPSPPPKTEPLTKYFEEDGLREAFSSTCKTIASYMNSTESRLRTLSEEAKDHIWWPFTQHATTNKVTTIDSAFGDDFTVATTDPKDKVNLSTQFDACSSWWTNGLGHGNPKLALEAAKGASRYGHVIFPEVAHQPAVDLTNLLLDNVGSTWADRVFFTDNGSTAVEVGLKMILRKRANDLYGRRDEYPWKNMKVIALEESYHGDTLGVMDCSPSSVFNATQMPWYKPNGIFLDPPTVSMRHSQWIIEGDKVLEKHGERKDLFAMEKRLTSSLAEDYRQQIKAVLASEEPEVIGGLLMEPVLQGAGGMRFIDPLYQRILADECQRTGIPVMVDEVFTGLWRLGAPSASQMLGIKPDVAAFAKLLTGGLLPLSVTLASDEIFKVFEGKKKEEALLHGHSYTAHPIGCQVAVHALQEYGKRFSGSGQQPQYWDNQMCKDISSMPNVNGVVNLGTVLAVRLAGSGSGYTATGSVAVTQALREKGIYARPLGNTVYLMCSPVTEVQKCDELISELKQTLSHVLEVREPAIAV
ncbi:hypothetical protein NDN08_002209 [Rhodosorus marinus]|uniref:Uncharacterized protein n=1 Tax=Rhodosorus marinus TaxID=101924 RepID=A0AAV8UT33_9RHOD|nr:hypothetical protein NDN08_002209 [Rhodosorus marinus]